MPPRERERERDINREPHDVVVSEVMIRVVSCVDLTCFLTHVDKHDLHPTLC